MKIYRPSLSAKLYVTISSFLLFIIGGIFVLVRNPGLSILDKIFIFLGFILGIGGPFFIYNTKIILDEERIESSLIWKEWKLRTVSLYWHEIIELTSGYVLFPESGYITLKPKEALSKKPIHIPLGGMPLELVKDILAHLPPDAKVNLYPYLKRKLEDKQTWFYVK